MTDGRKVRVISVLVAMLIGLGVFTLAAADLVSAAAPTVQPLDPSRLVDTRNGEKTIDGQYAGIGRRAAGSVTEVQIAGRVGIPSNASAAFVNLTSVLPAEDNFLSVYPCGDRPNVSNLNAPKGDIRANSAFVRLSPRGTVCIYTVKTTDLVVDITGWVPAGGTPVGITPARLFESRAGESTVDGQDNGVGRRAAGSTTEIQIAGRAGVPNDASAVLINMASVLPMASSYLTVFPCGERPKVSNLNAPPNDIRANSAFVQLSATGTICVYTVAMTDLIVDINGYVPAGASPVGIAPARLFESRSGFTTIDGQYNGGGRRSAGSTTEVQVAGRAGIPGNATAALVNLTSVLPDDYSYVTAYPCGTRPNVSNLNTPPNDIRAGNAFVKLSATGTICVYTVAAADLVIDVSGYLTAGPPPTPCVVNGVTLTTTLPGSECDALVALYNSTDGANWTENLGWLSTADPCRWTGVTCNSGHVSSIVMLFNNMSGPIPPEISQLTELVTLDIQGSNITSLPTEITQLTRLETLHIGSAALTSVPSGIGNLASLEYLGLDGNSLTQFPAGITDLTNLQWLDLSRNPLTLVPPQIGNLTNLRYLGLNATSLTSVPTEIGNLTNLNSLGLESNSLTTMPTALAKLTSLRVLYLKDNSMTGDVTAALGPLRTANTLSLLTLSGNGCLTTSDTSLAGWLTTLDPKWNEGCNPPTPGP